MVYLYSTMVYLIYCVCLYDLPETIHWRKYLLIFYLKLREKARFCKTRNKWHTCQRKIDIFVQFDSENRYEVEQIKWRIRNVTEVHALNKRRDIPSNSINPLLKPSGYYIYHRAQHSQILLSAHTVYVCVFMCIWEQKRLFPYIALTGWFL